MKGSESEMTSFHALSIGQMTEFHRVLATAGLTKEDVESLVAHPRKAMFVVLSTRLKDPVLQEAFTSHPSLGDLTGSLKTKGGFELQKDVRRP